MDKNSHFQNEHHKWQQKQEVKLKEIHLFAFSDMWVGNNVKLTLNGGTDKQVFCPSTAINSADIYTLSIDLGQNADV